MQLDTFDKVTFPTELTSDNDVCIPWNLYPTTFLFRVLVLMMVDPVVGVCEDCGATKKKTIVLVMNCCCLMQWTIQCYIGVVQRKQWHGICFFLSFGDKSIYSYQSFITRSCSCDNERSFRLTFQGVTLFLYNIEVFNYPQVFCSEISSLL